MKQRVVIAIALACNPELLHRRRADHGAGRDHSGAGPGDDEQSAERAGHVHDPHHPRPGRRGGDLRQGGRHVRRTRSWSRGDLRRYLRRRRSITPIRWACSTPFRISMHTATAASAHPRPDARPHATCPRAASLRPALLLLHGGAARAGRCRCCRRGLTRIRCHQFKRGVIHGRNMKRKSGMSCCRSKS